MKPFSMPLKVVFYKEGNIWLAHCLEFDLIGDGPTPKMARKNLARTIGAQIRASIKHKCLRNLFVSADPKFWEMFATGKRVAAGKLTIHIPPVTIERLETREHSESDSANRDQKVLVMA